MAFDKSNVRIINGQLFYENRRIGYTIDFLDYDKIEKEVSSWNKLKVPVLELVDWFLVENIRFVLNGEKISVTSHNGWNSYAIRLNGQVDKFKIVKAVNGFNDDEIFTDNTDNLLETLKELNLDRY